MVLGLYAAVFPLVANFAIDREPSDLARTWWPVLPLIAELAAIVLGAVFGLNLHHGSDSVAVAPGSFETKREPVIRFRADVLPQFRRFAQ